MIVKLLRFFALPRFTVDHRRSAVVAPVIFYPLLMH